ncbi:MULTISPECIES: 4-alpha-glucanotransferase [Atopobiaceae]|uniref:4-alpha-glucanotransferase n=1 Tax=Parafannyhessea umbonata TaxID=604330 RepID=A0A1H6I7D7_9ACTN|nr:MULTISPECIES: 4-alpha-glucanotransferase [Atopobiaceae]SEH42641.1 4-alpha-glucanotransferase [Parafannyhessea umbonata]SJZ56813.1 4-alpha-glucanotransferase [Olsenella sp. KH1P3]
MRRSSAIILPIYALPSPHGIGTLGRAAYDFVDFLSDAHQAWWQLLPVGPTSFGDSPYQSPSAFAGNPYLIDLDMLVEDGLLTRQEADTPDWGDDPSSVDYALLYKSRASVLRLAFERGFERDRGDVTRFRSKNVSWLEDYALFMAIKRHFGMVSWLEWPDEAIRMREPEAVAGYRAKLADQVDFNVYVQYLFFRQWEALRSYAGEKGVGIIGDLPIYVALDSSDVWAEPQWFQLDRKNIPVEVAGVPPDSFSADGQLWGNPLYDYDAMEADGYGWWKRRIEGASRLYDVIRIDHFRGFESYYAVPYGQKTARGGRWVKGPGMGLVGTLKRAFPKVEFIAEDLGYHTPEVERLLEDSGFPGMKVLEFAFDSRDQSLFLPHSYERNSTCYVGTHDNQTLMGWREEADPADVERAQRYLGLNAEEGFVWGFVRGGMSSVATLFVAQMQDYLGLGTEARTNTPGTLGGNWQWRLLPGQITSELSERIASMTRMYGRSAS